MSRADHTLPPPTVPTRSRRLAAIAERLSPARSTATALLLYLLAGAALTAFLFLTVHKRPESELTGLHFIRYHQVVRVWVEDGYLKHGGLAFLEPVDRNPKQKVWRSNSMAFLVGALLLERVPYVAGGSYSLRLMTVHNQLIVWLSAAALALLSMRMAMRIGVPASHAFLLGLGCQAAFQTFPDNLYLFWEMLPTGVVVLLVIPFLILEEARFERNRDETPFSAARAVLVFLLAWVEPIGAIFFLASYALVLFLFSEGELSRIRPVRTIALPALLGIALFALQIAWVRFRYPTVELEGSGVLFRTGLDGSTQYVKGHSDILTRKWPQPDWLINRWKELFLAGAVALVIVLVLRVTSKLELRSAVFILCVALGLYVPYAFTFSQAAAIHP